MRALVFSDSHGNLENMKKAINHFKDITTIFHLGDFIDDSQKILNIFPHLTIYGVSGNNDYDIELNEDVKNIDDYTIFMTHGDRYNVYYGIDRLYYKGKEINANIVLFGHTHKIFLEKEENYLMLNPGSISYPRDSNIPTFAILEYDKKEINARFFGIYKDTIKEVFLAGDRNGYM